jgi:hypothetical protein
MYFLFTVVVVVGMLGLLGRLLGCRTGCVAHRLVSVGVRISFILFHFICSAPGFQGWWELQDMEGGCHELKS